MDDRTVVAGGQVRNSDATVRRRGGRAGLVAVGVDVVLDRLGEAPDVRTTGGVLAMRVGGLHAQHQPGEDRDGGDAEDGEGHEELDERLPAIFLSAPPAGVHPTSTCWKMPYNAETSETATQPTMPPLPMMSIGRRSAVRVALL